MHDRIRYSQGRFRDGRAGDRYVRAPPRFFPPSLLDVTPPRFPSPPIVSDLLRGLRAFHLLVLGGHQPGEKAVFARHLAWHLASTISEGEELQVWQWHTSSESQRLEDAFEQDKPAVFIFPDLQPHHFGYDLRRLHEAVESRGHYAIIATESSLAQWTPDGQRPECQYWQDYSETRIYNPGYLVNLLAGRLKAPEVRAHLPPGLLPGGCLESSPLVEEGPTLRDAAVRLRTPTRVRSFVAALASGTAVANPAWIEEKLADLGGDEHAVQQWYCRLGVREQLLALGLALFDGLFDDQVFAALEVLVDKVWRPRDPDLGHFDYHELAGIGAYFHGVEVSAKTARIETGSLEHRQAIFAAAWKLHRRRILATLPMLVCMAGDSAQAHTWIQVRRPAGEGSTAGAAPEAGSSEAQEPPAQDSASEPLDQDLTRTSRWGPPGLWSELFGSPTRCVQLRRSVSETLSAVGLFSLDAVERSLVELAQDPRPDVQVVAAVAMARWRGEVDGDGNAVEPHLFKTLEDWLDESRLREFMQRLVWRGLSAETHAHVRATVALAVAYAALHDRPGQLAEELFGLFDKLLDDAHPTVRERFATHTLPFVVAVHLGSEKIEPLLRDKVLARVELLQSLAAGLAAAVEAHPGEALGLLERWYREALDSPRQVLADDELTRRETMLATVALTYGRMKASFPEPQPPAARESLLIPTGRQIFTRLRDILAAEPHPFVRWVSLQAMMRRTDGTFESVAPSLRACISQVTLEERGDLVEWLTGLYLRQRREQKGADATRRVEGVIYPAWKNAERPLTTVEKTMFAWLADAGEPAAKQLAMATFLAWEKTDLERAEREGTGELIEAQQEAAPEPSGAAEAQEIGERLRRTTWAQRAAVFLAAPFSRSRREALRALLPEYVELRSGDDQLSVARVLERWRAAGRGDLVRGLKQANAYHDRRGYIAAGLALLVAVYFLLPYLEGVG